MPLADALRVERLLTLITDWAAPRPDVVALALVGSWARGAARPNSDVDLVLLVTEPATYRHDETWPVQIPWERVDSRLHSWQDKDYGALWSRHVLLEDGLEIEFGFAAPNWASLNPLDDGTRRVIADGCRILLDKSGLMAALVSTSAAARRLTS